MKSFKKVLLVDDDPISNFLNKIIVEETIKCGLDIAENGFEALKCVRECILKNNYPVLILLDLNMPIMNGFEFLEKLENIHENPSFKIIILSSSDAPKDLQWAANYKILGYITKPLTQEKLLLNFLKR